jgi:nucleoside-diphosphate-sugar epimerase
VILVTGGTGFIGRHLVDALIQTGTPVRVMVREQSKAAILPAEAEIARGDLRDDSAIAAAVTGVRAVVHLAAQLDTTAGVDRDVMAAVNASGTTALVKAASQAAVEHVVYMSSAGVYGSRATRDPLTEEHEPQPGTPYERTKLAGEEAVRRGTASWTVLRPSGVFGAGRPHTTAFLRSVASRRVWLYSGPDTLLNPAYVKDVVAAIMFSLDHPDARCQVINLGGPRIVSHRELVGVAAAALGRRVHQVGIPHSVRYVGAALGGLACDVLRRPVPTRLSELKWKVINRGPSCEKARRLGISMTPLEDAMRETVSRSRPEELREARRV